MSVEGRNAKKNAKIMMTAIVMFLSSVSAFAVDERVPELFKGTVMTNESVLFMGTGDIAPLLYDAEEILSVRSSDLQTEYLQGEDWIFDAMTHRIRPTAQTRMPYYTEEQLYPESGYYTCNLPGKNYVLFGEGATMHTNQVLVTYRHADKWKGPSPRNDSAAFRSLFEEWFGCCGGKILFYGDSITAGYNSSGAIGAAPYIPRWAEQVFAEIVRYTGNTELAYVNTAVGGWTSADGLQNVQERVVAHDPSLVVLAFGMNDGGDTAANYSNRISQMVSLVHQGCPRAAILLVPPMIPNAEAGVPDPTQKGFDEKAAIFPEYETALAGLVTSWRNKGFVRIGLANVTTMHAAVLAKKRFRDMTGNNINHCNDFCARVYRDTILAALGVVTEGATPIRMKRQFAWFDGGVADGWPESGTMFGGAWQNAQEGVFADGVLHVMGLADPVTFQSEQRVDFSSSNAFLTVQAKFDVHGVLPEIPIDALASIIAVDEVVTTNFFVMAESEAGERYWRRLPGAYVRADEMVEISVFLRGEGTGLFGQFLIGDYVSPTIRIASSRDVGTVVFRGTGAIGGLSASMSRIAQGLILYVR